MKTTTLTTRTVPAVRGTTRRAVCRTLGCLCLAVLLALPAAALAPGCQKSTRKIAFDHQANQPQDPGVVSLKAGESFQLQFVNTFPDCFEYSYRAVELPIDALRSPGAPPEREDLCLSPIVHDGKPRDYLVFITRKDRAPDGCPSLATRGEDNPWVVPVRTFGWTVGFAGGFVVDDLTDPSYGLVEAEREVDGMTEQGFRVIRQSERDDDYSLGAAAMVHVFHTDPQKLGPWAPLTFGLAVNNGSAVRYFLGTSLRFSDQAFLTAGAVFGGRDRLPPGLDLGDNSFTTNANALNNLDSRNDMGWFVGVSYAFLGDKAKNALEGAIPTPTAKPGGGKRTEEENESEPAGNGGGGNGGGGNGGGAATVAIKVDKTKLTFAAADGVVSPQAVTVTLESGAQTTVGFALAGDDADAFTLNTASCSVKKGDGGPPCQATIGAKMGLSPGTYGAKLVATPENGDKVEVEIELTVQGS